MTTIAWATSRTYAPHDTDLPLLVAACRDAGVGAEVVAWDDPAADWSSYDTVVVRSCWDYVARRDAFLAWAAAVPRLHNPADVLAWNTDKAYLRQVAAAGVPVIETRWDVAAGDDLGDHAEWVVKPTVSNGSRDTARWRTPEEVWRHSTELTAAGRASMTQPYVSSVDDEGETALLYFGGTFSHAIRKGPLLRSGEGVVQDRDSRESITPRTPSDAQLALGSAALAATGDLLDLDDPPVYARVDVVTGPDDAPLLIELELAEPSVFLSSADGAADRFVAAVLART